MKNVIKLLFIFILFLAVGCATSVKRIDTMETVDLSGRWNDTDSRLVSEEMVADSLQRPWLSQFKQEHQGNLPIVIVGTIQNRSHEHINVQTFIKDLERALINSGEVDFVAGKDEREEIRDERKDQAIHSSEETAKSAGEELGADFMLKGTISTIQDKTKGKEVMFYQVNLELINVETNRKAWIGEKKIKKFIKRPRFSL
ncbi:MAG: penicillin-binding protein activator LpoB [bacterium]